MDHKLRKLYEQMTSRQSSVHNSEQNKYKSLSLVYEREVLAPPVSVQPASPVPQEISDLTKKDSASTINSNSGSLPNLDNKDAEMLTYITGGITNRDVLEKLYASYIKIQNDSRLIDSTRTLGKNNYGYTQLKQELQNKATATLVITKPPSSDLKIRTGTGRNDHTLGKWPNLNQNEANIEEFYTAAVKENNSIKIWNKKFDALLKCLLVFKLYKTYPDRILTKETEGAGLEGEHMQVAALNNVVKENGGPVNLYLPGPNGPVFGCTYDNAEKVKGSKKADLQLELDGKAVFWISSKTSKHAADDSKITFQQWGSLKTSYDKTKVKLIVDKFITKTLDTTGIITFKDPDVNFREKIENILKQRATNEKGAVKELQVNELMRKYVDPFIKGNSKFKQIHIWPKAQFRCASMGLDPSKNQKPNEDDEAYEGVLAAYRAIYGLDFSFKGAPFGEENINAVIETDVPILCKQFAKNNYVVEESTAHIIKNPDLPDTTGYLPYFYCRFTLSESFEFTNAITEQEEVLLCARLLIYPQARAKRDSGQGGEINLFK